MTTPQRIASGIFCSSVVVVLFGTVPVFGKQYGAPVQGKENPKSPGRIEVLHSAAEEHYKLGLAYLREPQNTEKAVEHLEEAVELDRSNAEYHFKLAEAYAEDFSYANIFRKPFLATNVKMQLELAVQHNPSSVRYREGLIQYYMFAPVLLGGSFKKARDHAEALRMIDPYASLLAYATVSAEEGEHERAVSYFIGAVRLRPQRWEAYHRYGMYCLNIHQVDDAIANLKKYVELVPDTAHSYESLASAYVRKRMYDEAIKYYDIAIDKDPSLTRLIFRIAQLYEFKGARFDALRQYQRYLAVAPGGRAAEDARQKIEELGVR